MPFEIGDFISVIDENVNGTIVDINLNTATVKNSDGFYLNYAFVQIVKDTDFSKDINPYQCKSKEITTIKEQKVAFSNIIDLHLEKLPQYPKIQEGRELGAQLNYAETKIKKAFKKGIKELVFIHGIGKGILKNELYNLVKKHNAKCFDASYKLYGQGASKVIFQ